MLNLPIRITSQDKNMKLSMCEVSVDLLIKVAKYAIVLLIAALTVAATTFYTGNLYIYLTFTIAANALLFLGFRKNAIFFDTFIGIFFWLGFWLKLTIRLCFAGGAFHEAVGDFDGSGAAFDHALWVTTVGMLGLIVASVVREKFIFIFPAQSATYTHTGIVAFYKAYRKYVLISFVGLFLLVGFTNWYLGIYQRGAITQTVLPFGLNGVYKWLLLFGLTSISAVILRCELTLRNGVSYLAVALSLLEGFATNVSLLSRGMILNVSALAVGLYASMKKNSITLSLRFLTTAFAMFAILFVCSVLMVNYLRSSHAEINEVVGMSKPLMIDRWVGIEGVMAVSSNPKIGWDLWKDAWREKYSENKMSFYDKNLITSPYNQTDFTKKHYISLPGILAFFYYPGSLPFLFAGMFLLGILAALIEFAAFKLGGGNLILCALIGEVVAYRFASFGYVPAQSNLLFGTIILNLFIIYLLDRLLSVWKNRTQRAR